MSVLPLLSTHTGLLHGPENKAILALKVESVNTICTILSLPRKLYQTPTSVAATLHILVFTSEVAMDVEILLLLNGVLATTVAALHMSFAGA